MYDQTQGLPAPLNLMAFSLRMVLKVAAIAKTFCCRRSTKVAPLPTEGSFRQKKSFPQGGKRVRIQDFDHNEDDDIKSTGPFPTMSKPHSAIEVEAEGGHSAIRYPSSEPLKNEEMVMAEALGKIKKSRSQNKNIHVEEVDAPVVYCKHCCNEMPFLQSFTAQSSDDDQVEANDKDDLPFDIGMQEGPVQVYTYGVGAGRILRKELGLHLQSQYARRCENIRVCPTCYRASPKVLMSGRSVKEYANFVVFCLVMPAVLTLIPLSGLIKMIMGQAAGKSLLGEQVQRMKMMMQLEAIHSQLNKEEENEEKALPQIIAEVVSAELRKFQQQQQQLQLQQDQRRRESTALPAAATPASP